MNKKVLAIILAILASFGGIAIYLLLYNVLGYIAFVSPVVCAVLFLLVYTKVIGEAPSRKDIILGVVLAAVFTIVNTAVATVVGWQIDIAFINADEGTAHTLLELLENDAYVEFITTDIIFNCLACLAAIGYLIFNVVRSANGPKMPPMPQNNNTDNIQGSASVIENNQDNSNEPYDPLK